MSYDISICDINNPDSAKSFNYTYNLGKFFHEFIHEPDSDTTGLQALHEKTGMQAFPILHEAFHNIEYKRRDMHVRGEIGERTFLSRYDSSNGWGSTLGAIMLLSFLMAECAKQPNAVIDVH